MSVTVRVERPGLKATAEAVAEFLEEGHDLPPESQERIAALLRDEAGAYEPVVRIVDFDGGEEELPA